MSAMGAALAAALLLAAPPSPPPDAVRAALEILYDGQTDTALARLSALAAAAPEDPYPAYVHALGLAWKVEQRPEVTLLDEALQERLERVIGLCDARLRRDPADARATLFRGAAHGVAARHHLFRLERAAAARASVRMRADLLRVRELDPDEPESGFGLGLYDYYADVLPRAAKVLRFLARIPGGDRRRGLLAVEKASETAVLHRTEALVQVYEIHAFYEDRPDRALAAMRALRARYPRASLWALKLAEHLRLRVGALDEAAAVADEILAAGKDDPNYRSPHVVALARLARAEALLMDLRLGEARQAVLPVKDGVPGVPALAAWARFLLGRALELEGDREGAVVHYRRADDLDAGEWSERAGRALRSPIEERRLRAVPHLVAARRHAEAGRGPAALAAYRAAREAWPGGMEAALALADDALRHADVAAARRLLPPLDEDQARDAPSLRAWRLVTEGEIHDAEGARAEAVSLYRRALQRLDGHAVLRERAAQGLRTAFRPSPSPARSPGT